MLLEVFSDVICPWCFIGKRRLDRVLGEAEFADVAVRWRACQLYPAIAAEGAERPAAQRGAPGRVLAEARAEGLALRFPPRLPNTRKAHELLQLAAEDYGLPAQHRLVEALFDAYFSAQLDLGDSAVLAAVGAAAGIPEARSLSYLAAGEGAEAVAAELERARALDVSGVPALLIAGRFALPGAQTTDTLRHVLRRAQGLLEAESDAGRGGGEA